jgi:uncharacterized protein YndB with AHSA1/START domain
MSERDAVTVRTVVEVEPAVAFEIFTTETDLWWGEGPRFRPLSHPQGRMVFEPRVGGRLLEQVEGEAEPAFELGRIEVWDPPGRLVFRMGGRDFEPDPRDWPVVEIRFEPLGDATSVVLEQRGFAALAADHPVRHGLDSDAFFDMMGLFWADLLGQAQRYARGKRE